MQHGVTGLKKNETIKEIMTNLAHQIHPNDHAFVGLVNQVWSSKQNEAAQPEQHIQVTSDLGNDVDLDGLEYIDEEEKKEFNQVREAAKRRIKERAAMLHDQIVEARAKREPKKRKPATKSDKNQKGSKRKPAPLSKKERKKNKDRQNKKLSGTEICKRARRLAIDCDLQIVPAAEAPAAEPSRASTVPADLPSQLTADQPFLEGTVTAADQPLLEGTVPDDEEHLKALCLLLISFCWRALCLLMESLCWRALCPQSRRALCLLLMNRRGQCLTPTSWRVKGRRPKSRSCLRRSRAVIILMMILLCTNFLVLKSLIGMFHHHQLKDPLQSSAARLPSWRKQGQRLKQQWPPATMGQFIKERNHLMGDSEM